VKRAGWDGMMQIHEEVNFTKGRIIVRGKLVTRGAVPAISSKIGWDGLKRVKNSTK
jgi:hypothetical protein